MWWLTARTSGCPTNLPPYHLHVHCGIHPQAMEPPRGISGRQPTRSDVTKSCPCNTAIGYVANDPARPLGLVWLGPKSISVATAVGPSRIPGNGRWRSLPSEHRAYHPSAQQLLESSQPVPGSSTQILSSDIKAADYVRISWVKSRLI
jgi:hypothetical protein